MTKPMPCSGVTMNEGLGIAKWFKGFFKKVFVPKAIKPTYCPFCRGLLYQCLRWFEHPVLGQYEAFVVLCENHKDAEKEFIIGKKNCNYSVGYYELDSINHVVMPSNMPILAGDLVWYKPDLSERSFKIVMAESIPQYVNKSVAELRFYDVRPQPILAARKVSVSKTPVARDTGLVNTPAPLAVQRDLRDLQEEVKAKKLGELWQSK